MTVRETGRAASDDLKGGDGGRGGALRLRPDRWSRFRDRVPEPFRAGVASLGWVSLAQFVVLAIKLASNLILTRLLAPEVYGIFGTAMAVLTTLDWLSDLGVQPALIRHPEGGTARFLLTGWWISLGRGGLLWCIALGLAAPLAWAYHQPELFGVLIALSFRPALLTLRSPGYPTLRRDLNFRALFLDEVAQLLVSTAVSLALAFATRSIWSIVGGTLAGTVTAVVASYIFCPVAPRRAWDRAVAWEISLLSRQVFLNTLVMAFCLNLDRLLGLRFVSPVEMGFYTVALNLSAIAEGLLGRCCDVYLSAISRCTDLGDRQRWHRKITLRLAAWVMPVMAAGVLVAPVVVRVLYDARYAGVRAIFPLLIARLMVRGLGQIQYQYLLSLTQVRINTVSYVVATAFQAAVFVPLVVRWGALGMATAALLSSVVLTGVQYALARRLRLDGLTPYFVTLAWTAAALLALEAIYRF